MTANDVVNHPAHYTTGPTCECGRTVECITVAREHSFARGNAIKYLWRAGLKDGGGKQVEDLRKAAWYIADEIARLETILTPNGETA